MSPALGEEIGGQLNLAKMAADTGCHLHNDCLTCPLPMCIYDQGGNKLPKGDSIPDFQRAHVLKLTGLTAHAIAMQIGRDPKTVRKWLKIEV